MSTQLKGIDDILAPLMDDSASDERSTRHQGCGKGIGHPDDDIRQDIRDDDVKWSSGRLICDIDIDSACHVVPLEVVEGDLYCNGVIIGCDNACSTQQVCTEGQDA